MKFTKDWLDVHLKTNKSESQIIQKLNSIGLEVEKVEPVKNELSDFIVAKIIKANKHPNADRLKLCDVDIGKKDTLKVVCGAPNARDGLLTIYAPPGSVIPKNGMKLEVSKIRGETSYGMLCSESELKLSNESEGIIDLNDKYKTKIGKSFFGEKKGKNVIELSITPNRPDCLGVRGIARDLSASNFGKLKEPRKSKVKKNIKHNLKIKIEKNKNQACSIFGSCIIKNIKNTESPGWLKNRILALGLRPISAVVDITNYVMFDLNRPLHAYDLDKIKNKITVRNSKKGESFKALDNKNYTLDKDMCVIADDEGVLGLGGIIGGERSGTEIHTKNILLESAYFDPTLIRKTAKKLDLNSDAKFRFERGVDPQSVTAGLDSAVELILEICGGEVSKLDVQQTKKFKDLEIKFDPKMVSKTVGTNINTNEIKKILSNLGFTVKTKGKFLNVKVPSWRPDIFGEIDLVEEVIRIIGFEKIKSIEPEKKRTKPTLNFFQKHFHLAQRSVASKGYLETITWSFTDEKINNKFKEKLESVKIVNPISSDLNVLRNSLYPNLIFYLEKNLNRGFGDQALFEIGPTFTGKKPGQQITVVCGIKKQSIDEDRDAMIFTIGDNDTFALWYAQEIEEFRTDVRTINTSLLATDWYIDQMKRRAYESSPIPSQMEHAQYAFGVRDYIRYENLLDSIRWDINDFVDWVASDNPRTKYRNLITQSGGDTSDYPENALETVFYPTNKIRLPVNKENVIKSGLVKEKDSDLIVDYIDIDLPESIITKNQIMMLDILANNDWERPIYFTGGSYEESEYIWMKDYLQLDGLVYKLVPIKTSIENNPYEMGRIDSDLMYDIVKKWSWGNSESDEIYHDPETRKNSISFRGNLSRLSEELISEGEYEKAEEILDLAFSKMPIDYYGYYSLWTPLVKSYYDIGKSEKVREIVQKLSFKYSDRLSYFSSLEIFNQYDVGEEIISDIERFRNLIETIQESGEREILADQIKSFISSSEQFNYIYGEYDYYISLSNFLVSLLELNELEYSMSVIDKIEEQLIRRVSVFSNIDEEEQVYYIEGITSDINQYSRLINQIEVYDNDAYNKYDKNLKDMLARMIE